MKAKSALRSKKGTRAFNAGLSTVQMDLIDANVEVMQEDIYQVISGTAAIRIDVIENAAG